MWYRRFKTLYSREREKKLYLILLVFIRFFCAIWSPISDCDETFNYWEPTSYLLFDKGFQTWEYSPDFSIRSYTYILPHVGICSIGRLFYIDQIFGRYALFYFTRVVLGFISAFIELYFVRVIHEVYSPDTARFTLIFLLGSPGMFTASVAYLPGSFSMYFVTLANTLWMSQYVLGSLISMACSCIFGWPFACLSGIMLAFGMIYDKGAYWFISRTVIIGGIGCVTVLLVDYHYFHKYAIAPLNIILYNVHFFEEDGKSVGQNLYGIEPWHYLIKNLLLNFNIAFPLSLFPPLVCDFSTNFLFAPYFICLLVFSIMAHKEERFLFIIYPLICFCAGKVMATRTKKGNLGRIMRGLCKPIMIIYLIIGMSRIWCLLMGYGAPLTIYAKYAMKYDAPNTNLCIGKEWYRFPNSLFTEHSQVHWLRSHFHGQLPVYFLPGGEGTYQNGGPFNDVNREEESRFTEIDECDFIVDLEIERQKEPFYSDRDDFEIVESRDFLDNERTSIPFKWLYVPVLWNTDYYKWGQYRILRRISGKRIEERKQFQIENESLENIEKNQTETEDGILDLETKDTILEKNDL